MNTTMTTKSKASPHEPRVGAFTLMELLIVIVVISILMALLMPLIGQVRASAHQVACANNLRQLGIYSLLYAANTKGYLPPASNRPDPYENFYGLTYGEAGAKIYRVHGDVWGSPWNWWSSYVLYQMFLEQSTNASWNATKDEFVKRNLQIFFCHASPIQAAQLPYSTRHEYRTSSYAPNSAYLGAHPQASSHSWDERAKLGMNGWPGYGVGINGMQDITRRINSIHRPSDTIQLGEVWGDRYDKFTYIVDPPFVQDPVNRLGEVIPASAGAGSRTGPFASAIWALPTQKRFALRASHRDRANFVFMDGRVALLDPWQTASKDYAAENMWTGR